MEWWQTVKIERDWEGMQALRASVDQGNHGLRAVHLENEFLRVVILPEAGAKIWQITYKPLGADLLWNNAKVAPAHLPMDSLYDDNWSGGWDELFPNDEVAVIAGRAYPDHGELWTGEWKAEPFSNSQEAGVHLSFLTPVSSVYVEKTITLRAGSARLWFQHKFTNRGTAPFPFLWKLHPAFAVTPQHRIDFPAMQVVLDPAFYGTLEGSPAQFAWPHTRIGERAVDLRQVPPASERQLYFIYGTEMEAGWCAITNTANRLACGLRFDPEVLSCAWLFATYGGWRDYNVAVLEPCTGYPLNFEAMVKAGNHRTLPPGGTLSTEVLFSAQEGLESVAAVQADGALLAELVEAKR
jgi:hypothetical protein